MATYLENIIFGKKYTGIEFFSLKDEDRIAFLQVERKKNEIIISKNEVFSTIEDLSHEKSKSPVAVVVNNSQVLFKEVQGTDANDRKLLHKAFPNLQTEDFYYEIYRKENISIISICRKIYIDNLLKSLEKNFRITSISLGLSSIDKLLVVSKETTITTNTQTIFLENEENIILTSQNPSTNYNINGLEINNAFILSFSGLLAFILPSTTTGSINDLNNRLHENFKQQSFFEKVFKSAMIFIISILLINFLLFSYYFDNVTEMTETISLNKVGIENITKTRTRIKEKEERLNNFNTNSEFRSAALINQMVKDLPTSITLTEITFHPLEKKIKDDDQILTNDKFILISGTTLDNEAFTSWIESLDKIKKTDKVMIINFGKDRENKTVFSLQIIIQHDEVKQEK